MHPIERLRYVARASGVDHAVVARETAAALAGLAFDHAGIVTACRRVVERHPASGPVWWMASRVLTANDPVGEAWDAADDLADDATAKVLAYSLDDDITIVVLGWPEIVAEALPRRGDVEVLAIDTLGEGIGLVRRLRHADVNVDGIAVHAMGAAVVSCHLLLLEASAAGPDGFIAIAGSRAAAAVAHHAGVPVWLVCGLGRMLNTPTWNSLSKRLSDLNGLEADDEFVPRDLVDMVVTPNGVVPVPEGFADPGGPVAPELFRTTAF